MNNLTLTVENEIAVLTITRPAALNALNSETLDELNTVLTEIEGRDVVLIRKVTNSNLSLLVLTSLRWLTSLLLKQEHSV